MNVFCSDCRREVAPGTLGRCSTCDGILRPEYPDEVVAQWRGYLELQRAGLVDRLPRMIAVQSVDAPPLLEAFRSGNARVPPLPYAKSRISGINVPFTGEHALAAVRDLRGVVAGITDDDASLPLWVRGLNRVALRPTELRVAPAAGSRADRSLTTDPDDAA